MEKRGKNNRTVRILDSLGKGISLGSGSLGMLTLAGMTAVTLLGVVFRYIVRDPLQWTEELARFLMLWTGFLGMNAAMYYGQHFNIDSVVKLLPARVAKALGYISDVLVGYFLIILTIKGYAMTMNTMLQASTMDFSMFWIYMAIPLGAFLTLVQLALKLGAKIALEFEPADGNPSISLPESDA